MSIDERDILFYAGALAARRFGTFSRRTTTLARRGEDLKETFTRAAPDAIYKRSDGAWVPATTDRLRWHWFDTDGDGILDTPCPIVEPTRTNGWTRGSELDNAAWSKTGCTIGVNAAGGPDGATTADKIIEDSGTSVHAVSRGSPALTNSTPSVVSAFVGAAGRTWCHVETLNKANIAKRSWVNLATGAKGTTASGHVLWVDGPFNGLYRISCQFDSATGGTAPAAGFFCATGDNAGSGSGSYTGDGASGIYVAGLQFEADCWWPSSWIPTTTAAVTRAAETLSMALPRGLPSALTLYLKIVRPAWADLDSVAEFALLSLVASSTTSLQLRQQSGFPGTLVARVIGSTGAGIASQALPAGTTLELCAQVPNTAAAAAKLDVGSGFGSLTSSAGVMASPLTAVQFGHSAGTLFGDVAILAAIAVGKAHTLAEFQEFVAA